MQHRKGENWSTPAGHENYQSTARGRRQSGHSRSRVTLAEAAVGSGCHWLPELADCRPAGFGGGMVEADVQRSISQGQQSTRLIHSASRGCMSVRRRNGRSGRLTSSKFQEPACPQIHRQLQGADDSLATAIGAGTEIALSVEMARQQPWPRANHFIGVGMYAPAASRRFK